MNIATDIEKLASLRDRGDLTQAEFEQAKARLLAGTEQETDPAQFDRPRAPAKVLPGLGLALGVLVGNLLYYGFGSGDFSKGLGVGLIAALIVMLFYLGVAALKRR